MTPKIKDISGQRFGRLVAISREPSSVSEGRKNARWLCVCDCGNYHTAILGNLGQGKVKSCGCLHNGKNEKVQKEITYMNGYAFIKVPGHPRANKYTNRVRQHIIVMEQILGRHLLPGEEVHHLNGVRDDNRPENLELWTRSQPAGARVEDKISWAVEILRQYKPEVLNE